MPKVSVIIPIYNTEKYLRQCLDSIINQTLSDIEIICVNDGSTDNSSEILQEYAQKDNRIKPIIQKNQGVAASRNNALKIATGEYVLCVDSDDYIRNDALELIYKKAKTSNLDMLSFEGTNFDNKTGKDLGNPYYEFRCLPENFNTDTFTYKDCINFITKMAVSSCLTAYKFDFIKNHNITFPDGLCFEDNVFFHKALLNAQKCGILNEKLYFRRVHSASITQNWEKHFGDYIKIADKVLSYLKEIKVDTKLLRKYSDYYLKFCIHEYNSYSNKTKKIHYNALLDLVETHDKILAYFILKPLKPTAQILSVKNDILTSKKIITILGLNIKLKSKKLVQLNKIKNLEIRTKRLQEDISNTENIRKNKDNLYRTKIAEMNNSFNYKLRKYCAPEMRPVILKDWFFERTGENLNLDNPQTFNEKIQWMKLYDSTPIKTQLADKYLVREWVKEKIGEEYLIPLLGVWDNFDEIDFEKLPNQFVLKCNHGCGYNIIVKDKTTFNIENARKKINAWLREDFAFKGGFELHYSDIPRKIIAEKYIENSNDDLYDYKVWCFNGKAQYVQFLSERNTDGLKMAFYDRNWNKQDFYNDFSYNPKEIPKPNNLDLLIELSEKLAKDINYVRVDFYITNSGQIYFGEMTFTPTSGSCTWDSYKTNLMLGQMIELNKEKINV